MPITLKKGLTWAVAITAALGVGKYLLDQMSGVSPAAKAGVWTTYDKLDAQAQTLITYTANELHQRGIPANDVLGIETAILQTADLLDGVADHTMYLDNLQSAIQKGLYGATSSRAQRGFWDDLAARKAETQRRESLTKQNAPALFKN